MKYSVLLLAISSIFVAACEDDEDPSHEPKIYFKNDGVYEIAPTDTLLIEPKIIYDKRSTYQWLVDNQVVSNELNYLFAPQAMRDYSLTFSVDNSNGADTFNLRVSVVKNIDFEQFDNFTIPSKSDLYLLPDTLTREFFIIDDVRFNTQINADTTEWNGLAFSNRTSPANSINDAKAGCAYVLNSSASKNYGVVHNVDSLDASKVIFTDRSYSVKSIDVANDNFVYLASKYGYLSADSALTYSYFSYDDYLRLLLLTCATATATAWISQSKKQGNSVTRNRIKRRLREAVTPFIPHLKQGYNIIFVARSGIPEAEFSKLTDAVREALCQAKLLNQEDAR